MFQRNRKNPCCVLILLSLMLLARSKISVSGQDDGKSGRATSGVWDWPRAWNRLLWFIMLYQEPITRSVQLPHIPVTAFSQTDVFLVWICGEFRPPQEPQWSITSTDFIFNYSVDICMSTSGRHFFLADARSYRPEMTYLERKEA